MSKATKTTEMLAQSITLMEQLKRFNIGDKDITYLSKRDISLRMKDGPIAEERENT